MSGAVRKPTPGLRSPREEVEGWVYFGRMVDKIRLEQAGTLSQDYRENLGQGFDESCCSFLGVRYQDLREEVRKGASDGELLAWCGRQGQPRGSAERRVWNGYLSKRGWRDDLSDRLAFRKKEAGWEAREEIQTFFDYIDADEGRG